jgi:hypothetical protein
MASHELILDTYFWAFVDAGIDPDNTPLFNGMLEGRPLAESVAVEFGLSLPDAEEALELARLEVAL